VLPPPGTAPDNPEFSPIVITPDERAEVRVVAEVVAVLP